MLKSEDYVGLILLGSTKNSANNFTIQGTVDGNPTECTVDISELKFAAK